MKLNAQGWMREEKGKGFRGGFWGGLDIQINDNLIIVTR